MMADSRWVGYSFLTVRPPGDYFWYLPFYSIHGADAAITVPFGESVFRAKAFYGHSRGSIPLADEQWDISGSPMVGGYLDYQYGAWQVRASYANIHFKRDLPIAPVLNKALGFSLSNCWIGTDCAMSREIGEKWTAKFGCEIIDGIGSTEMLHIFL